MKEKIHPKYQQATVTCASCKTVFQVGSTRPAIRASARYNPPRLTSRPKP